MYDPSRQGVIDEFGEPVRWVAGPNRQFEKMMRHVMENIPNSFVFMKEFDTTPQMENHFGNLFDEIAQNEPFYMLGSVYEGNKWDGFRDQMDDDLLTHLHQVAPVRLLPDVNHHIEWEPCWVCVESLLEPLCHGALAKAGVVRRLSREPWPLEAVDELVRAERQLAA